MLRARVGEPNGVVCGIQLDAKGMPPEHSRRKTQGDRLFGIDLNRNCRWAEATVQIIDGKTILPPFGNLDVGKVDAGGGGGTGGSNRTA